MSNFPETDVYNRVLALPVPAESCMVVGSAALETVVGPDTRRAEDIDLLVTQDAYDYFRDQSEMQERTLDDGSRRLYGEGLDIGTIWGDRVISDLRSNAYTNNAVTIAGLPDLYAHKERRALAKDTEDLQLIRRRLYGDSPMPMNMLGRELSYVQQHLPERLHDRPELQIAANGLYIVRTVFGHEETGVHTYTGPTEQWPVASTYHAWMHTADGIRVGQRNLTELENRGLLRGQPSPVTDDNRIVQAVGYGNHDAVFRCMRLDISPDDYDERASADLARRHLEALHIDNEYVLDGTHAFILSTGYNQALQTQDIDPARGHLFDQQIGTSTDLHSFRMRDGVLKAKRVTIEDMHRVSAGYDRPLGRLVDWLNQSLPVGTKPVRIETTLDGMQLIDAYPDFPVTVTKQGTVRRTTLKEAYAEMLENSARFVNGYRFPETWVVGSHEQQMENGSLLMHTAKELRRKDAGAPTCEQLYLDAVAYAQT